MASSTLYIARDAVSVAGPGGELTLRRGELIRVEDEAFALLPAVVASRLQAVKRLDDLALRHVGVEEVRRLAAPPAPPPPPPAYWTVPEAAAALGVPADVVALATQSLSSRWYRQVSSDDEVVLERVWRADDVRAALETVQSR